MIVKGDYVKIVRNGTNHDFKIGDIVKVEETIKHTDLIVAYNDRITNGKLHSCVLSPDDFELYYEK